VAASCAIPGYFAPVTIGDVEHFDGAVHSPTNADVLAREALDVVVVVSPMSGHGRDRSPAGLWRELSHRRLGRELRALRRRGKEVVVFEPTTATRRAMGINLMADDRAGEVVAAARAEVRDRLARPAGQRIVDLLAGTGVEQAA
jgi:NTE family protein